MSEPTTPAPDQRDDDGRIPVTRTLETLLGRNVDPTPEAFVTAVSDALKPDGTYRCMNPKCDGDGDCAWPKQARRPQRFCSRRCRQIFERVRARLVWEITTIDVRLMQADLSAGARELLVREVAQRRWALERYPLSLRDQATLVFDHVGQEASG